MIAVARRAWTGLLVVALVTVCLVAGAAIRSVAQSAPAKHLALSVPGRTHGFTTAPAGPVLDTHRLEPGRAVRGVFGVRNDSGGPALLSLSMIVTQDTDQCPSADAACTRQGHNIADRLIFSLGTADDRAESFVQRWRGSPSELTDAVAAGPLVPDGATRWLRLSASLPMSAGNAVQRDELHFALRVTLDSGVRGEATAIIGGHRDDRIHIAGLAVTGAQLGVLTGVALGLLAIGLLVTVLGRRRARPAPRHSMAATDN